MIGTPLFGGLATASMISGSGRVGSGGAGRSLGGGGSSSSGRGVGMTNSTLIVVCGLSPSGE
jgi:hypothetical protein